SFAAASEQINCFLSGTGCAALFARSFTTKEVHCRLGHHDFHDGFAVASARGPAGFAVRVTAAADQRGVTDSPRQLATGSPCRSCRDEAAITVHGNSADSALFVAAVVNRCMLIFTAAKVGLAFGIADQFGRIA